MAPKFAAPQFGPTGYYEIAPAVFRTGTFLKAVDTNGDSIVDLVVVTPGSTTISVLFGDGHDKFKGRLDSDIEGLVYAGVLAVVPAPAVTATPLYVIEDRLAALIETAELVSPEQEQEFRAEFQAALTAAVDRRDRAGQFLAHLEQQIDFAKFEIDRLRQRRATCEHALARLENYVIGTIENLGTDDKGKYRRLEGKITTFSLRACPSSVEVVDETAILQSTRCSS
jgi:hypothetical protein